MARMKRHQFEVKITGICHGFGIGSYENRVVYVKSTVPGDIAKVWPIKIKRSKIIAKVDEYTTYSPLRDKSDCPHFPDCGGCAFRSIPYKDQLKLKQQVIETELSNNKIKVTVKEIIPAPQQLYYRNKMEYTFGTENGEVILGMHKKGEFSQIVHTSECYLQSPEANLLRKIVVAWANKNQVSSYNPLNHEGALRHLLVRDGKNTKQMIVGLVTTTFELAELDSLVEQLKKELPIITGFMLIKNTNIADTITFEEEKLLFGKSFFHEKLKDRTYKISPASFFQTNTLATENLYKYVKDLLIEHNYHAILDLYCGAGSIGIFLSDKDTKVVGCDINEIAIKNAKENAELNNLINLEFFCEDVKKFFKKDVDLSDFPVAIVDPPREGIQPKSLNYLLDLEIPNIVYVSCNPKTLAQNLADFSNKYEIISMQPFDLFPYTPHLENVVLLKLKG